MTRGRQTHLTIRLTPGEQAVLEHWQRSFSMPAGQVRRGRIILLLVAGASISAVAREVGISRRFVYKWAHRFLVYRLPGLMDHRALPAGRQSS